MKKEFIFVFQDKRTKDTDIVSIDGISLTSIWDAHGSAWSLLKNRKQEFINTKDYLPNYFRIISVSINIIF